MQGPNAVLSIVTYPPGATNTQARIVIDGTRGAIFEYVAGPVGSSLVSSWAATAGTDPYGQSYPAGFNAGSGSSFTGTDFVINQNGAFFYNGTPALGNLQASITTNPAVTSDAFGATVIPGITSYNSSGAANPVHAVNMATGSMQLFRSTSPTAAYVQVSVLDYDGSQVNVDAIGSPLTLGGASASAVNLGRSGNIVNFFGDAAAPLPVISAIDSTVGFLNVALSNFGIADTVGVVSTFVRSLTDNTTFNNPNNAGATQLTAAYTIPANTAEVGTCYEIHPKTFKVVNMEGNILTLGISLNGSTSFSVSDNVGGAIVTAGVGIDIVFHAYAMITAIGSGGTADGWVEGVIRQRGTNALFTNSAVMISDTTSFPINTTVSNNLRINSLWAASNAGQNITCNGSKFLRVGP